MIKDTTINEQLNKINQKQKVIVAYVLYPCSMYRMYQVKNNSTKDNQTTINNKMMEPINNRPP